MLVGGIFYFTNNTNFGDSMENRTPKSDDGGELEGPLFARTPGRDIFGDLDERIAEIRVPADVKVDIQRAASQLGLDVTAWVRELIYASLYGPEHVATLYQRRAERVRGNAGHASVTPLRVLNPMRKEQ